MRLNSLLSELEGVGGDCDDVEGEVLVALAGLPIAMTFCAGKERLSENSAGMDGVVTLASLGDPPSDSLSYSVDWTRAARVSGVTEASVVSEAGVGATPTRES